MKRVEQLAKQYIEELFKKTDMISANEAYIAGYMQAIDDTLEAVLKIADEEPSNE